MSGSEADQDGSVLVTEALLNELGINKDDPNDYLCVARFLEEGNPYPHFAAAEEVRWLLDEEEKKIRRERDEVSVRLAMVRRQRNEYKPINRLGPEILQRIFLLAVESQESLESTMRASGNPMTVSNVSYGWRMLVLSSPPLWRRLHFGLKDGRLFREPAFLEWTGIRLARSGEERLELSLSLVHWTRPPNYFHPQLSTIEHPQQVIQQLKSVMAVLRPELTRCRSLTLAYREAEPFRHLVQHFTVEMPVLERLTVNAYGVYVDQPSWAPKFWLALPMSDHCLRSMELTNAAFRFGEQETTLQHLCSLRLDRGYLNEAVSAGKSLPQSRLISMTLREPLAPAKPLRLGLLQRATNLQSLYMRHVRLNPVENAGVVQFPRLIDLEIVLCYRVSRTRKPRDTVDEGESEDMETSETEDESEDEWQVQYRDEAKDLVTLFERIEMPHLRRLRITAEDAPDVARMDPLLEVLARKLSSLRILSLRRFAFEESSCLNLLRAVRLLRTLTLRDSTVSSHLLDGLKPTNIGMLCPDLRKLHLWDRLEQRKVPPGYKPYTRAALERMVKARHLARGTSPPVLELLTVQGRHPRLDEDNIKALRDHVRKVMHTDPRSYGQRPFESIDESE